MRSRALLVRSLCSATVLTAACLASVLAPAAAITSPTVLTYSMDEPAGATVMVDSGISAVNGTIGGDVTAGVQVEGATGYRFPHVDPLTTTVRPGHLATIADSAAVDPGAGAYSVEVRYRTLEADGANLVQKGQATSPGGQFKIQVPEGNPQCYYKGSLGKVGATSLTRINDGAWHTLRCARTSDTVSLYVDGVLRKRNTGPIGTIDNAYPMTIGGKSVCDMVKVQCDYFGGTIDYITITKG